MFANMPTVWRLENVNGVGPYASAGEYLWVDGHPWKDFYETTNNNLGRHPSPFKDNKLDIDNYFPIWRYHFGFSTLSQYKKWVYKKSWREFFDKEGFKLVKYTVEDEHCKIGDTQVIFKKANAVIVQTRSPAFLDK